MPGEADIWRQRVVVSGTPYIGGLGERTIRVMSSLLRLKTRVTRCEPQE